MIFQGEHIDSIIFDLGGVILNIDYQLPVKAFSKLGVTDFHDHYSQAAQKNLFDLFETGKIDSETFLNELKKSVPPSVSDEKIRDAWNSILLDLPEERLFVLEKAAQNHRIFMLSNTNEMHINAFNQYLNDQYNLPGLEPFFDKVYYSYEIGLRKPDLKIFEYVIQDADLNPSTTLFIDDSIQHITAAADIGIITHHLKQGDIIDLLGDLL